MFRLTPNDVRVRVHEDHVEIRSRVQEVRDALRDASSASPPRWGPALSLCDAVERHMEFEDAELVPLLSAADAWGSVRAGSVAANHRVQGSIIIALREDIRAGVRSTAELVDEIRWFLGALERDLESEEDVVFADDAFGEEAVVSEQIDG